MKRGGYAISEEKLKEQLLISKDSKITHVAWNPDACTLSIYMYGDDFPETEPFYNTELKHRY